MMSIDVAVPFLFLSIDLLVQTGTEDCALAWLVYSYEVTGFEKRRLSRPKGYPTSPNGAAKHPRFCHDQCIAPNGLAKYDILHSMCSTTSITLGRPSSELG